MCLWQPLMSIRDILISKSFQIFLIFFSKSWFEIWFEIQDISTLLQRPYFSFLDSCFSKLTILFAKILSTFFTTVSSMVGLPLVFSRILKLSETFVISLHRFWIWLWATTYSSFILYIADKIFLLDRVNSIINKVKKDWHDHYQPL